MYYVYILRSKRFTKQTYIGYTKDLRQRFEQHNQGHSKHTSKFRPWELVFYAAFPDKQLAMEFEDYLNGIPARPLHERGYCKKIDAP